MPPESLFCCSAAIFFDLSKHLWLQHLQAVTDWRHEIHRGDNIRPFLVASNLEAELMCTCTCPVIFIPSHNYRSCLQLYQTCWFM